MKNEYFEELLKQDELGWTEAERFVLRQYADSVRDGLNLLTIRGICWSAF